MLNWRILGNPLNMALIVAIVLLVTFSAYAISRRAGAPVSAEV